jgi:hypothetical protein
VRTAAADLYPEDARERGAPAADLAEAARLGRDLDALFGGGESRNVLAVKASYWLSW